MTKKKIEYTLEQRAQDFVMALREPLMEYYKGTCIDNLNATTNSHGIRFTRHNLEYDRLGQNRAFNYERREHDIINPMRVYFYNSPLMDIRHEPDTATLFVPVFKRSPELTEVFKHVKRFYESYLPGVELVHDTSDEWQGYAVPMEDSSITVAGRYIPELDRDEDDYEEDDDLEEQEPDVIPLSRIASHQVQWSSRDMAWTTGLTPSQPQMVYFDEAAVAADMQIEPPVERVAEEWTTMTMGNTMYDVNTRTAEIRNIRTREVL